jgi:hypothetical protein
VLETWRRHYNTERPHASLGYRTGARSLRTRIRRVAGCPTPTSSAGHAPIARYSTP